MARLFLTAAMLLSLLAPMRPARAAGSNVLLHLDGGSATYTDSSGSKYLTGTAQFSDRGRAFGSRLTQAVKSDPTLGGFPYGVYGVDGADQDSDGDFTDPGDVDPRHLMDDIKSEGVYNIAVDLDIGTLVNQTKMVYSLRSAQERDLKLIVRPLMRTSTQQPDVQRTTANLARLRTVLTANPDLKPVVYALYGYDEPANHQLSLATLQSVYSLYKATFPELPVIQVFNQNQNAPDANGDGISDLMLGQSGNPYGPGVADIVVLDVYPTRDMYGYDIINNLYSHTRRVVSAVSPATPIWAIAQAHAAAESPTNVPETHHLYRQINDWLRAGPENGLPQLDGFIWYHWHFPPASKQAKGDLEDSPSNRAMARLIGSQLKTGKIVLHDLPYRKELCVAPRVGCSTTPLKAPRLGHFDPAKGTITMAISHMWSGDDGVRHVFFDTGESATKNRLTIEKGSDSILRLVVTDSTGKQKWTGIRADGFNTAGRITQPGYNYVGVTWSSGTLALYLDGIKGTLTGGTGGTGVLSGAGSNLILGADLNGAAIANGTFRYLTIRNAALTPAEVAVRTRDSYLASAPAAPVLVSPAAGAATTDRTPTFSWGVIGSAVQYRVEVSTTSRFTTLVRDITVTSSSYTTPTALGAGTYYWRVRSVDQYGVGVPSVARSVIVQ